MFSNNYVFKHYGFKHYVFKHCAFKHYVFKHYVSKQLIEFLVKFQNYELRARVADLTETR
jgi:hypothetical protein